MSERNASQRIIDIITENGVCTTADLMERHGLKMDTASKQLRRMYKEGKLTRSKGDQNEYNYYLPESEELKVNDQNIEQLIKTVCEYASKHNHRLTKYLPVKLGGKLTGGSGQASGIKAFTEVIAEMLDQGLL